MMTTTMFDVYNHFAVAPIVLDENKPHEFVYRYTDVVDTVTLKLPYTN